MARLPVPPPRNRHGKICNPCMNPDCDRWISPSVADPYCCGACRTADQGIGGDGNRFEVHEDGPLGHSEFCNQRVEERGTQYARPRNPASR
jgi:hypothetical protein